MTKEKQTQHDREIAEIRQLQRESADRWREHDERMKEHDERMVQLGIRADKALALADKALAVADKNNKYIGDHSRNEGTLLETECYNTLKKSREINGIKLDD